MSDKNLKLTESSLPEVANRIKFQVGFLEGIKDKITALTTVELIDGYADIKDVSKKIDSVTKLARDELVNKRFENECSEIDEKGNKYLTGCNFKLKAEKRVSKPVLKQDEAYKFFEDKGLLHKVSDVSVNLSTDDIGNLVSAVELIDTKPTVLASLFNLKTESSDVQQASAMLHKLVENIQKKSTITISDEKVSALVSLGELELEDVEHLYDVKVTYALKVVDE